MKFRNRIFSLAIILSLTPLFLNANVDCLGEFQSSMAQATIQHQQMVATASSNYHVMEADAWFAQQAGIYGDGYSDCCDHHGGPGCP